MTSAALQVESVVIGAGVVGLAVARSLAVHHGQEVLLLDRAASIGAETSSRNSEVIHAGLYYPADSWKAQFCVRGRELLYEFCRERHVPFRTCGKLIVGNNNTAQLESLRKQALSNGVQDVQLISADQVAAMEPEILALPGQNDALWSPSTGIVDSHAFLLSLLAAAEETGSTTLALHSNVKDARILSDGRVGLRVGSDDDDDVHSSNSDMWLSCGKVFNCAGLWADEIARNLHINTTKWQPPRQYYCKGNYFRLQGVKPPFSHLIYPLPDVRGGLGVHATIDLAGQVKFGPDVEWLDANILPDEIDWNVDGRRADAFYQAIRQYWPALPDGALAADYAGARPKLVHPDHGAMPFADFVIAGPEAHGVQGLVHLFGIESPGLTSALALAEYVTAESLGRH